MEDEQKALLRSVYHCFAQALRTWFPFRQLDEKKAKESAKDNYKCPPAKRKYKMKVRVKKKEI